MAVEPRSPVELADLCNRARPKPLECRFRWAPALRQSARFLVVQHLGNLAIHDGMREELVRGHFLRDYGRSLQRYRFDHWSDDDASIVDYVGHPIMGAVTGFVQIQNDPAGAALEFGRSRAYWKSRARAMAWSAAYAAQWELGPFSETSIGNVGLNDYVADNGRHTNGTGMTDLVVTPTLGTAWLITEDALDRWLLPRLEAVSERRAWLLGISILNPARSVSNMLRLKSPWYRDTRPVRSRSTFR